ncbi:MAG: tRNA (N6-isopentenyl adenosine(37)-C2)-methylthiotransferase MiaB [Chloroflexota bacterium]|nr:tRNA (N6-isopentenyl adenosine(37)-C2)-methylthiotransferase MiaB [Chloroflexota bacterium]
MDSYYIWTIGCQMNVADSQRLGSALEQLGLHSVPNPDTADVIVLNSCVVRQSAEDKVVGNLTSMKPLKSKNPERILALMGCKVGDKTSELAKQFPYVDVFMKPQQYAPLLDLIGDRNQVDWEGCIGSLAPYAPDITCHVPIIHGCDLMCSFCIIPYRRGRQISRPIEEIIREVELLVQRGTKEVTVLGQTVDAYGLDLPNQPDLSDLLIQLNEIDGLSRIRFLTSHPSYMSDKIIGAVSELTKVCEHINLPVQAGDDAVLERMRRPYTQNDYKELVYKIRDNIPGVSVSTDMIVGFPGETEAQYQSSLDLITELKFDKIHTAAYSPRPGTISFRTMDDDVPQEEKNRRLKHMDILQEEILTEINRSLVGEKVEVLVEGRKRGKLHGRTRTDKLVFIEESPVCVGSLQEVLIEKASPWSLQGSKPSTS